MNDLKECHLCGKECKVNRYNSVGFCKATNKMKIALVSVHMWEEPCISGENGSGTIFFSNCNLRCVYCQNYKISSGGYGKIVSIKRFADICLELQSKGVNNINLVTPTHYVPQIIMGLKKAKERGLNIPIVYNTSSYESIDTIKSLEGFVDVYLADLKYYDDRYALKYSKVDNYFEVAKNAIDTMFKQVGYPVFLDEMLVKGLIVRVLLLPGLIEDAKKIISYLYNKYGDNIYISITNQYTPVRDLEYAELNEKVRQEDYDDLVNYAYDLGVRNAFIQESGTVDETFIPNFDKRGV